MIIRLKSATFRYRVGRITHVSESIDLPGGERTEPSVFAEDVREFRTLRQAKQYQAKLPGTVFIQYGVLQWLSGDDAMRVIEAAQSDGAHIE